MRITSLFVYPIKSCRGTALLSATVLNSGLLHDRRWMLVTEQGRFVTQREQPRMALIEPVLVDAHAEHSGLQVHAPDMPVLSVGGHDVQVERQVKVWGDEVFAFDEGDVAATWFSRFLDMPVRLVRFNHNKPRWSDAHWTGEVQAQAQFADGFPLLLISQASLDDLNARLLQSLPMNRFRPNMVMSGLPAYGEDLLRDFGNAEMRLRGVKPCTRCKITTTDQDTAMVVGQEPLATLAQYRWNPELRGVTFGQNVIVVQGAGNVLRVGQELSVME